MQYRREIDGLRALAVLPVILFHAGFELFSGGFIGVDVFFVISGYLITNIIYGEIQAGEFSLVRFYERRVRRILPALIFVSLVCIPFAWFWMLPDEFAGFARSLIAVNIFASNILFLQESSRYFSASAELMPMLHTWSLAVEEQFYLLFPLFLLIVTRFGRTILLALLVLCAAASLGVSDWGAKTYPLMNFYLLPTRAWELGVGAILAIAATGSTGRSGWLAQCAAAIGLGMVVWPFFFFDRYVGTPSFSTLIPVLGTAMIIAFGRQDTVVGKMLGWKPIVGIGLISYSAYLWHQPVFAFARIRFWDGVSDATYLGLSLLALILAYFSWRFVEQPFRNKSSFSRQMVFFSAAGFSVLLILFGFVGDRGAGFPWRHENEVLVQNLENRLRPNRGLDNICNTVFKLVPECRTSDTPEIIVWGDSHAMHLVSGVLASNPGAAVVQMTKSRCAPILDLASIAPPRNTEKRAISCLTFNENVKNYISETKSLKYAVLASPLTSYLKGDAQFYFEGEALEPDVDFLVKHFKRTLDWLIENNVSPVVFQSPPSNGKNAADCIARSVWLGADIKQCNRTLNEVEVANAIVDGFMSKIAKSHKVVRLKDYICKSDECIVSEDGVFIYRDSGHLSHEGSRHLGRMMDFYGIITGSKNLSVRQ